MIFGVLISRQHALDLATEILAGVVVLIQIGRSFSGRKLARGREEILDPAPALRLHQDLRAWLSQALATRKSRSTVA